MNYTEVMNTLKSASLFDMYRLRAAIQYELENPERIRQVRQSFKEGDIISYFNMTNNTLVDAIVQQKNPKYVIVKNLVDQKVWQVQYCSLNLNRVNIDIQSDKLSRNNLKIGDCVGFNNDGTEIVGIVIRLNQKTVTLVTHTNHRWRVSYRSLFKVIDADIVNSFDPKQISQWVKEIQLSE